MMEIERKFRLNEEQAKRVAEYLEAQGVAPAVHQQADKIFLYKMDSFKNFTLGDPVMRLRSMDGKTLLTYKRAVNAAGDRVEHELGIDATETMEKILQELGYMLAIRVEKRRVEYKLGDIAACLDDVSGLGMFLELETICSSEDDIPKAQEKIMALAATMGLSAADIEVKKYDQLLDAKR